MNTKSLRKSVHPEWVLGHRKPNTEIKLINGKYYLYGVKSVYDKALGRSKKVSLGILGRITQSEGFIASEKQVLKEKSEKSYLHKSVLSVEYGFSRWLVDTLKEEKIWERLQKHFPDLWQFIVVLIYCRVAHQSPLKNIPFWLTQSDLLDILQWKDALSIQKISDLLFELGSETQNIHAFLQPTDNQSRTVLMDATDVVLQSNGISLAQKGYNSQMSFQSQFVLLYLYDATSSKPLYYRLLPGNIREISALKNTIKISGLENCVYIADKGFFSSANLTELERLNMEYVIPLKRDNSLIPYYLLKEVEQTDDYFEHAKRFIFHTQTLEYQNRKIELFLDGKLREQEKTDYLSRINTLPEKFSKSGFNNKINTMGTLAIIHNTTLSPKEIYLEYKSRGQIEQFFDHLKNTLDAACSYMQREQSLNGWMFINHLSMTIIYYIYLKLKTTPLNKKQMLNHKYSISDTIEHLKSIKKIKFSPNEAVLSEQNKLTKLLLQKLNISIT